jgi:hypothetical protein
MNENNNQYLPSEQDVADYKMLSQQLDSLFEEMKEFSKKKPDEFINKVKVKIINRVLEKIKTILSHEPTLEFLDLLDEDTLPTNSDVVLILGQFNSAIVQFRIKYYENL